MTNEFENFAIIRPSASFSQELKVREDRHDPWSPSDATSPPFGQALHSGLAAQGMKPQAGHPTPVEFRLAESLNAGTAEIPALGLCGVVAVGEEWSSGQS